MELRMSSVPLMLEYLEKMRAGSADMAMLRGILGHEDYQFEIRRYALPSVEPLETYFSQLTSIRMEDIPDLSDRRKSALRDRHALWLDCAADPQKYYGRYERVKQLLCQENLRDLQNRLSAAFPEGVALQDAGVVSTLSFGPSFGYVYENAMHLDLLGIETVHPMEELPYTILHEMHHLQFQKIVGSQAFTSKFSLLDHYIFQFAGEGLAVKFCNNAEGIVSKRMDPQLRANIGLAAMPILNCHFEEHFRLFCDTVRGIRQGTVSANTVEEQFRSYWQNPYLYKDEVPVLTQAPVYSFGNELFGCIFDAFGLETLFECLYAPSRVIEYFNRANCGYTIEI